MKRDTAIGAGVAAACAAVIAVGIFGTTAPPRADAPARPAAAAAVAEAEGPTKADLPDPLPEPRPQPHWEPRTLGNSCSGHRLCERDYAQWRFWNERYLDATSAARATDCTNATVYEENCDPSYVAMVAQKVDRLAAGLHTYSWDDGGSSGTGPIWDDSEVDHSRPKVTTPPRWSGSTVVCNDGWISHSGGKQGACSHHGGVR